MSEVYEGVQITMLGRRCQLPGAGQYPSVVERNASHFAPLSWHRWRAFHRTAREMITRSFQVPTADRAELRTRARIYAGYADHFLQDSFAAGHQPNKTLVMQWYAEWLTAGRWPGAGRASLAAMTQSRQPRLHRPDLYHPAADRPETDRTGAEPRLAGQTPAERHAYLAFRASVPVQIFAAFPRYVETGGELLPLPAWHENALRDLCFGELFPRWQTRATQLLLTATLPRPGNGARRIPGHSGK
jgi:hypothetical protein